MATTITSMVSSLGAPLVPDVAESYNVSLASAQWTLTAALLAGAVAVPILGRLGSQRYRRPVSLAAVGCACIGTLVAALDLGFAMLICGRILQGISMGVTPIVIAIAYTELASERVHKAVALLSVTTAAGAGLGYPLSCFLASQSGLQSAYWAGFICSFLTLLSCWAAIPAGPVTAEPKLDWAGAFLLSIGVGCLLLALTQGTVWGWLSTEFVAGLSAGIIGLAAWTRWALCSTSPLLDLRVACSRGVVGPNVMALLSGIGLYMVLSVVMLSTQAPASLGGSSRSAFVAGLMFVPLSLTMLITSRVVGAMRRLGPTTMPIGSIVMASGAALISVAGGRLGLVAASMAIVGVGVSLCIGAMPITILRAVGSTAEASAALSANQLLRNMGYAIGSALTTVVVAASQTNGTAYSLVAAVAAVVLVVATGLAALGQRSGNGFGACATLPHQRD